MFIADQATQIRSFIFVDGMVIIDFARIVTEQPGMELAMLELTMLELNNLITEAYIGSRAFLNYVDSIAFISVRWALEKASCQIISN